MSSRGSTVNIIKSERKIIRIEWGYWRLLIMSLNIFIVQHTELTEQVSWAALFFLNLFFFSSSLIWVFVAYVCMHFTLMDASYYRSNSIFWTRMPSRLPVAACYYVIPMSLPTIKYESRNYNHIHHVFWFLFIFARAKFFYSTCYAHTSQPCNLLAGDLINLFFALIMVSRLVSAFLLDCRPRSVTILFI